MPGPGVVGQAENPGVRGWRGETSGELRRGGGGAGRPLPRPNPQARALKPPRSGLLVSRTLPHPGVWPHCGWTREGRRPEACDSGWGPQPSLSLAEQHLESPVPSAPGALAGGPTQAAPGVRGEEEQWAREIGAQLRRMADDLNAQYERRRQEEQQRHRPSPWRVLYNLIMGLLPLPRGHRAPEMEPN
nr:bcl-2-binding component 3 isoform X3 [Microcebus murinus]